MNSQSRNNLVIILFVLTLCAGTLQAQVTRVDELEFPPLPEFQIPQPTRVVLDNGIVVMVLEDRELPLVNATVLIKTGARLEPADKVGLASMTGTVMRTGGTRNMTGDELDDYLEGKAARVEVSIGESSGTASMSSLRADFPEVFQVLRDVLRYPAFEESKLGVAKNQAVSAIARRNDNPQGIMSREFQKIIYGSESPYARTSTYATIGAIQREDLVNWHRQYFHPNRMIIGLVGDFDTTEAVEMVKRVFGDWEQGPEPQPVSVEHNQQVQPGVYYVEKSDVNQSYIMMGHLGIVRNNPDYYAVEVLNQVLSGTMASRLFSSVRTAKGLAYAVSGGVGSGWDRPGTFNMWMTTKTETTGAGIEALQTEARDLTARPPDQEEVDKAKTSILNSFIFNSDTRAKILGQQLTYEYYGYPLDWLTRYREGIERTTVEEVREAARKYVHMKQFAILVVGPPEGLDRPLSEFGTVTPVDITIPEGEAAQPATQATPEATDRGRTLLAKAVEGMGGESTIDAIDSLRFQGVTVANTPQGEFSLDLLLIMDFPNRIRQEVTLPFGKMAMVYTPQESFAVTPNGVQPLPESQAADLSKSFHRQQIGLLKLRKESGFAAVFEGNGEVEGTSVENVRVEVRGERLSLAIDPASGHILQLTYRGQNMQGVPGEVVQTFSDFRQVQGVTVPFRSVSTFNGEPLLSTEVQELVVNAPVEDKDFQRP
jgi:zinc protease